MILRMKSDSIESMITIMKSLRKSNSNLEKNLNALFWPNIKIHIYIRKIKILKIKRRFYSKEILQFLIYWILVNYFQLRLNQMSNFQWFSIIMIIKKETQRLSFKKVRKYNFLTWKQFNKIITHRMQKIRLII